MSARENMTVFGSNLGIVWEEDPKMLGVRLARYTFVSKMFAGMHRVLEVGAGCGTLARVVRQTVGEVVLTDRDPQGEGVRRWDPTQEPFGYGAFDGAYALDVLEHVPAAAEDAFIGRIAQALTPSGSLIVGVPSREAWQYGSANSLADHINNKTEDGLRETLRRHFRCVYLFGMNDALVHTGFGPMCHYRLALCNTPR